MDRRTRFKHRQWFGIRIEIRIDLVLLDPESAEIKKDKNDQKNLQRTPIHNKACVYFISKYRLKRKQKFKNSTFLVTAKPGQDPDPQSAWIRFGLIFLDLDQIQHWGTVNCWIRIWKHWPQQVHYSGIECTYVAHRAYPDRSSDKIWALFTLSSTVSLGIYCVLYVNSLSRVFSSAPQLFQVGQTLASPAQNPALCTQSWHFAALEGGGGGESSTWGGEGYSGDFNFIVDYISQQC